MTKFRNRKWKTLYRELERLRALHKEPYRAPFPDLSIEPRLRLSPPSNRITETHIWKRS